MFNLFKKEESSYKGKLSKAKQKQNRIYSDIEAFSERIKSAMGISDEDLKEAYDLEIEWDITGYTIYPVSRCHDNCKLLLEARTYEMAKGHGYSNVESDTPPSNWHYRSKGTATEVLPDSSTQQSIITLIKEGL